MLNEVNLIGRLGKNPEEKQGQKVNAARFPMAVGPKDHTEWVNIVAYDKLSGVVMQYLEKGSLVYVKGSLNTVKYKDKSGEEKYFVQVAAREIKFLSDTKTKSKSQESGPDDFGPPSF